MKARTRILVTTAAICLASAVAVCALFAVSGPASAASWNQPPTFGSESEFYKQELNKEQADLESRYGLQPGFSAAQYGAAHAEHDFQALRKQYHLPATFSAAEFAAVVGVQRVRDNYGYLKLPSEFTVKQLRQAIFLDHAGWATKDFGLPAKFSFDDYVQKSGAKRALELATRHRLPTLWDYKDLVAAVGPMKASSIRHEYDFARGAGHDQIVTAIGRRYAKWFAHDNHLPENFTAEEMGDAAPVYSYSIAARFAESDTESDLAAALGLEKLQSVSKEYGLPTTFNSADLKREMARRAIAEASDRYDLDGNFNEQDMAGARALSELIHLRTELNLRPDFTASEYEAAYKKKYPAKDPKCQNPYDFTGIYTMPY